MITIKLLLKFFFFFQKSVTLLTGFNGVYEGSEHQDEDFQCTNYRYGEKHFSYKALQHTKNTTENKYDLSNVKCYTPDPRGYSTIKHAHSVMDTG